MLDDIRRVGEKIDGLLGTDIFPFNYPFSHTENFLQHMGKWEFAIPNRFLWLVNIEASVGSSGTKFIQSHPIPRYINTYNLQQYENGDTGQHSGGTDLPASYSPGWDIDQSKREITQETYMRTGGQHGCILSQGVVLPGEQYEVRDVAINNNMGLLPGKVGGNRSPMAPLTIQWRETNRSFVDTVIRPWLILTSHVGLAARPPTDDRNIKANISIVQLAKTYQYTPLVERKVWRFYNCVPTSIDSKELTYQDGNNFDIFTTQWHYTHYTIESLPNQDMGEYMNKEGFKRYVSDMATKLLKKSKAFRKIQNAVARVEKFVDKANVIKKKVNKVLGFLGKSPTAPGSSGSFPINPADGSIRGRTSTGSFRSD